MEKIQNITADTSLEAQAAQAKKHNTGAKVGVAIAASGIGGKLGTIPGIALDLNGLFPKGISVGEKLKRAFSKEVLPLYMEAVERKMAKGHNPNVASLLALKWSIILPTVAGLGFGYLGWKRADRIQDSKDIYKHPIKSGKIILGFQEPDATSAINTPQEIKGKYTAALANERSEEPSAEIQR